MRYDDRGTAASKGNFGTATSKDFATDVEAGVTYLLGRKEINKKKIGLIGHSEGGVVAPMVAANSKILLSSFCSPVQVSQAENCYCYSKH